MDLRDTVLAIWFFCLGMAYKDIARGLRWLVIPTYYEPLDAGGTCANCRCRKSYHTGPKGRCIRFMWEPSNYFEARAREGKG